MDVVRKCVIPAEHCLFAARRHPSEGCRMPCEAKFHLQRTGNYTPTVRWGVGGGRGTVGER